VTVAALAAIESLLSARVAASLADTGPVTPIASSWARGSHRSVRRCSAGCRRPARSRGPPSTCAPAPARDRGDRHALVLLGVVLVAAGPVGRSRWPPSRACSWSRPSGWCTTVRAILRSTRADAVAFVATASSPSRST
jgi:SulP family sulfate permease